MEAVAVVILIGLAVYFFLKHITRRGTDTVRAYLYLRAINAGVSVREANQMAQVDLVTNSHYIPEAKEYVRIAYGGKQLPMIADARRLGLLSAGYDDAVACAPTQTPMSQVHSTAKVTRGDLAHTDFDTYNSIFIAEVKRLSGKASGDLHWVPVGALSGICRAPCFYQIGRECVFTVSQSPTRKHVSQCKHHNHSGWSIYTTYLDSKARQYVGALLGRDRQAIRRAIHWRNPLGAPFRIRPF
jgi:hypothetical protein